MSVRALKREARYLVSKMTTFWGDYDFDEITRIPERRVPKLRFDEDAKILLDKAEFVQCSYEIYIREVWLEYNGTTYIFEISSHVYCGVVSSYWLEVYTPKIDGKSGKRFLLAEKI